MNAPPVNQHLLACYGGEPPPAPGWFREAMAAAPDIGSVESQGTAIEYLAWGERGRPGLLLLHGGAAHCWWWAHIAPFFAATHRVAAMSMAGMGGSGWRESYDIEQHARDMRRVAVAAGLDEAGPPAVVGHSFGGAPVAVAAAEPDRWLGFAIVLDSSLDMRHRPDPERFKAREGSYYASLEEALARFRLMPPQDCDHHYIADMIARHSLVEEPGSGWRWKFDPNFFARVVGVDSRERAKAARCPLAVVYGDRSLICGEEIIDGLREDLAPETPFVAIPDSGHHVMLDQPLALVAAMRALLETR